MESGYRTLFLTSLVLCGIAVRVLLADIPNFAPVGALALFAGASFCNKRVAIALPILVMLATDLILGFHSSMFFVYTGMVVYTLLGMWAGPGLKLGRLLPAALAGSFAFFLISNFGAYLAFYPRSWSALIECYALAIPFAGRTLASDLLFGSLLFGILAFAQRVVPSLQPSAKVQLIGS